MIFDLYVEIGICNINLEEIMKFFFLIMEFEW